MVLNLTRHKAKRPSRQQHYVEHHPAALSAPQRPPPGPIQSQAHLSQYQAARKQELSDPEIHHQSLQDWQAGLPLGGDHPHRTCRVRFIPNSGQLVTFQFPVSNRICISIHGSPPPEIYLLSHDLIRPKPQLSPSATSKHATRRTPPQKCPFVPARLVFRFRNSQKAHLCPQDTPLL